MMKYLGKYFGWVVVGACLVIPGGVAAHFCSNIFRAHSKIVVKAEKTSVVVGSSPTTLRVYFQNNFPFRIRWVEMTGTATGYTISVSPGAVHVYPGQQVGFVYTITGPAATVPVTNLNLRVRFRDNRWNSYPPNGVSGWKDMNYYVVNQNPTASSLSSAYATELRDANSMIAATLADKHPTGTLATGPPTFGRTGLQQLIKMFGYRFCWTNDYQWRCGAQDCPSPCAEGSAWAQDNQFANNCLRAGAELAVRKSVLGSQLAAARAAAVNSMKVGGSNSFKCMGAIVGGYLYQGASSATAFTAALQSTANAVPLACRQAGLRVLNGSNPKTSCSSGQFYERAACAAAEGIRASNDSLVNSVLKPNALDNCAPSCSFTTEGPGLFYAYMLYIVSNHRRSTVGYVSFYPDAGISACSTAAQCNDNNVCTTDTCTGGSCQHVAISGCCTSSSQCNDNNACTTDSCSSNTCQNTVVSGCCTSNSQCNDNNACTTDSCSSNTCQNTVVSGCCTSNSQCNDSNACTTDTCNTTTHLCQHASISGCCTTNSDCADNNPCTTDTCNTSTGNCSNTKKSGCCIYDTECDDTDSCTLDTCNTTTNSCTYASICKDAGPGDTGSGDASSGDASSGDMNPGGDQSPGADLVGSDLGQAGDAAEQPALSGGCVAAGAIRPVDLGGLLLLGVAFCSLLLLRRRRSPPRRGGRD
jgi:Dictyostelium (slime mold) repeat